jgi:hypothetical protein
MQRGVEQNPPKKTGGFYSTPLLEGRGRGGSAFIKILIAMFRMKHTFL